MKKILYIPSWYPTPENKLIGSFFREQALLFDNDFDFFVFTTLPLEVNFIKFLYLYIKNKFQYFDIQQQPKGTGIYYYQIKNSFIFKVFKPLSWIIERVNYKVMCKSSLLALKSEINRLKWSPDLIHAQSTVDGGILAHFFSIKFDIPYIITEHQFFLLHYHKSYKIKKIFSAVTNADIFLAVSEHQKRHILINGIDCFPLVVGNFVDDLLFNVHKQKQNTFNILAVTYPSFIKDNETLFKTIKYLVLNNITNFKFQIIGGDFFNIHLRDKENPLYKQAESFDVIDYVEILNFVEREKMPDCYNKCDVFISTSIAETFGVSICEAMMCGVPVIATSNGAIDDMISEINGIKVSIQDYVSMANAIIQIKENKLRFDAQEIRKSVLDKFGTTAFKNKLMKFYDTVINE